jgi:dipeptidyl aminopeptidase/acylaminoacyl peptidase
MTHDRGLPCGTWPSPLSPERCAAGATSLAFAGAHAGTLMWVEGRPAEKGRSVLMGWTRGAVEAPLPCHADEAPQPSHAFEVLPPGSDVRSRVHEYGGLPWCAAGERLVYSDAADQRLRVREADGSVRVLSPEGCRYADACALPDARFVVAVREDHRPVQAGQAREPRNEVVLLDLSAAEDEGRVLWGGSDFVAWPRPSPDGTLLAFVTWNHPDMPWDATRLVVGRFEDGQLVDAGVVAGGPGESVLEPWWDVQGTLHALSDRTGWWNLYRFPITATHAAVSGDPLGGPTPLAEPQALTTLEAEVGGPLWQLGMSSYVLLPGGGALLRVSQGGRESLARLDGTTRTFTPLNLPYVAFSSLGLLDAHTAFAIAAGPLTLPALITIDLREPASQTRHHVVRTAGSAPLPEADISMGEALTFPTAPGPAGEARGAHAWFYPPRLTGCRPRPGERPPLIVLLHGGPTALALPALKVNVQFWTSRGFAVVDVNYGGSTGYGRAYRERLAGQWGVVDLQDACAAVDHLVAEGRVDPQRIAIRGGSAGGFTVLSALAFTRRFAAGINYYGVADLESLAADTHKFEARYLDRLVAPLPEGREVYRARSPLHHMAGCHGALLTLQGSEDRAVPPQQSRAIVAAARAAGCRVEYLEFEGEGHGFRQQANIVRGMQAELAFLGEVFGFGASSQTAGAAV